MPTLSITNWTLRYGPNCPIPQRTYTGLPWLPGQAWGTICYGGGQYITFPAHSTEGSVDEIVVNAAGWIGLSPDGINWTYTLPYYEFNGGRYGYSSFVASCWGDPSGNGTGIYIGVSSIPETAGSSYLLYSIDGGLTWIQNKNAPVWQGNYFTSINYGNGVFVLGQTTNGGNNVNGCLFYSTDGINWSRPNSLLAPYAWWSAVSIAYGNGQFVMCNSLAGLLATSTNGITWTDQSFTPSDYNPAFTEMVYGNGFWAATHQTANAAGYDGTQYIWTSPSAGKGTWTGQNTPKAVGFNRISFVSSSKYEYGYFINYNSNDNTRNMYVSINAVDWSTKEIDYMHNIIPGVDEQYTIMGWNQIVGGFDRFVAVSADNWYGNGYGWSARNVATMDLQLFICFKEGSKILCLVDGVERYVNVEDMRKGTLVKTLLNGYKAVESIGKSKIYNPDNALRGKDRLYKCTPEKYPELTEDLIITGCHSILIDEDLTPEQIENSKALFAQICVTEDKYRLMACVDERAEPYDVSGLHTIWHFALEHDDVYMNYGVYANGGLMVETSSIRMMHEYSGLELLD